LCFRHMGLVGSVAKFQSESSGGGGSWALARKAFMAAFASGPSGRAAGLGGGEGVGCGAGLAGGGLGEGEAGAAPTYSSSPAGIRRLGFVARTKKFRTAR
jgi:hypothetical protein